MNYQQTVDYLYAKLPMFTRVGAVAIKKDLHNTLVLCEALDNPHLKFKSIHVAGTNGKGSTSHMLAAVLQKAGYKVGLYTSPHLKDFRERIRINGKMISKKDVVEFVRTQKSTIEKIEPSFFEVTVAMAFDHFANAQVDIAVIEVGLGGRLDSTNIITPELSVITNISLDHTNVLGNTLPEIAKEKAGIIKRNIPVVIGEIDPETQPVFIQKATLENAEISFAPSVLAVKHVTETDNHLVLDIESEGKIVYHNLKLDLTGVYQTKNILTVLHSIDLLTKNGFHITQNAIKSGLSHVKKLTGLQGRWQQIGSKPLIICDTGHNIGGITEIVKNLEKTNFEHLHMVIGMVKDKDINGVLQLLPTDATYYFCKPDLERALDAESLSSQAAKYHLKGLTYPSVAEAFQKARAVAQSNDLIFVGGSTFVVAEVI